MARDPQKERLIKTLFFPMLSEETIGGRLVAIPITCHQLHLFKSYIEKNNLYQ